MPKRLRRKALRFWNRNLNWVRTARAQDPKEPELVPSCPRGRETMSTACWCKEALAFPEDNRECQLEEDHLSPMNSTVPIIQRLKWVSEKTINLNESAVQVTETCLKMSSSSVLNNHQGNHLNCNMSWLQEIRVSLSLARAGLLLATCSSRLVHTLMALTRRDIRNQRVQVNYCKVAPWEERPRNTARKRQNLLHWDPQEQSLLLQLANHLLNRETQVDSLQEVRTEYLFITLVARLQTFQRVIF